MKKFLILTWSTGSGHISASNALNWWIRSQWHDAHVEDICHFSTGGRIIKIAHKIISEYLGIIGSIIFYTTNNWLCKWIRHRLWAFSDSYAFSRLIQKHKPDHIIFTQKSRIPLLSSYVNKNEKSFTISSVFVHYGRSIHTLWIMDPAICDYYFVFDLGSESYLIDKYDIPAQQIIVSFLPIPQDVFHKRVSIDRHKLIILCTWLNTSFIKGFLNQYKDTPEYNIVVVSWRNTHLKKIMSEFRTYKHITFYRHYNIGSGLKNFDVFIGKPWWAVLAECIASETPIICPAHFHGEEDANKDIIRRYGVGYCIHDPQKVAHTIATCDFQSMLPKFNLLKKDSCDIILKTILQK